MKIAGNILALFVSKSVSKMDSTERQPKSKGLEEEEEKKF